MTQSKGLPAHTWRSAGKAENSPGKVENSTGKMGLLSGSVLPRSVLPRSLTLYWTGVTFGTVTVMQAVGHDEGLVLMERFDPLFLLAVLPLVPAHFRVAELNST